MSDATSGEMQENALRFFLKAQTSSGATQVRQEGSAVFMAATLHRQNRNRRSRRPKKMPSKTVRATRPKAWVQKASHAPQSEGCGFRGKYPT